MTRPATTTAEATSPATSAAAVWGTVLPIPAGPGAGDDFEARVSRVWQHLKAGYFAAAEHGRLGEVLRELLDSESKSNE